VPASHPYLEGPLREVFDRWIEAVLARAEPLTFREIRKGVRALSSLYVERRDAGGPARALEGRGKRAAFASYYAALHFLTTWHALDALGDDAPEDVARVLDLGCGTGAAGAAAARALGAQRVLGLDRSGWALAEARRTYAAFGLDSRTRRGALPAALPNRAGSGDLLLLAWTTNELADPARDELRGDLQRARERGARLLLLEPLSGRASPWWNDWCEALPEIRNDTLKRRVTRPAWIAQMDKAAGLDHSVLGARLLVG